MTDNHGQKRSNDAQDRFEAVRGKADVKWLTDDLMAVLRGDNNHCLTESVCPGMPLDPGASHIND